ncbi:hydroxyacylglutathione hydrolase [Hyphomicrobium sp.]|uniref:hydroxyacylglutathione hydrolase n=1 Tax=Hyphomicrobium sp. TaxID=82 RepID=UPI001D705C14|nr:hydroxyacylglutathione hydrolase [Hyphomicrobium sp.]MBY0561085.1 hydroxyacylglutathione hydrolase [Hyphomicrobium sp.]
MGALDIVLLPCLADNYSVLLHEPDTGETAVIDAPCASAIKAALAERSWRLNHLFITHHHTDHTGGINELKAHYGASVTGPETEVDRIAGLTRVVKAGSKLEFAGHPIEVLETPGHTLGHLTYYFPDDGVAFTGDTLFSLGCGKVFEGDPQMMWESVSKIAALPGDTKIYCGHEYTLNNARFAVSVEPENDALKKRVAEVEGLRAAGRPTLPTTIDVERATNPFLRPQSRAIQARLGMLGAPDWEVFARLRQLKNKA